MVVTECSLRQVRHAHHRQAQVRAVDQTGRRSLPAVRYQAKPGNEKTTNKNARHLAKHTSEGRGRPRNLKCLALLALLAPLQDSLGNMRVFQGCQRMPMAPLTEGGGQGRSEARER